MAALNVIGCVTAITELLWCLGPLLLYYGVIGDGTSREQPLVDRFLHKWSPKLRSLFVTSNVAFLLCGILAHGLIVRSLPASLFYQSNSSSTQLWRFLQIYHATHYRRLTPLFIFPILLFVTLSGILILTLSGAVNLLNGV